MNKVDFLNELREKLAGLPKEDLDNRISFYEEMINDRMDEGKSEEEAIAEIGSVDEIVKQIASETSLVKLIKEKAKPKKEKKSGWTIALIILGFPLWLPLLITAFALLLVAYILVWVLVIITYSIELSLAIGFIAGLISFIIGLAVGQPSLATLGAALACLGVGLLFIFACIGATKVTLKLSKAIIVKIKTAFMRKGNKE